MRATVPTLHGSPSSSNAAAQASASPGSRIAGEIKALSRLAISGYLIDGKTPTTPVRLSLRIGEHSVAETRTVPGRATDVSQNNFRLDLSLLPVRRRISRRLAAALAPGETAELYLRCYFSDGASIDLDLFDETPPSEGWVRLGFDPITGRDLVSRQPAASMSAKAPNVDIICFYLPQFHPIDENDAWWGPGFTEWTNLARMQKQFGAHTAPWLPADLGFYDLRLRETRKRQAELARQYGVAGFCYYVYWFQGRRLLERPLQLMLEDGEPDIPFCICWANENWSRRWDGSEAELLIGQEHSVEADKGYIDDMATLLADDRYIHVDGKKILLVYRPSLIPDRATVFGHWRQRARDLGLGELMICNVMTFGEFEPTALDCDMAVEFPPHTTSASQLSAAEIDATSAYEGSAYNYLEVVRSALGRQYNFDYFPGVMPRWDNTPRKGAKGNVFVNASPDAFEIWLRDACRRALSLRHDRKLVFVNSWNEWAEGAHIEPDSIFGRAYLEAVQRVASGTSTLANLLRDPSLAELLSREELEQALRQSIFFNETLGAIVKSASNGGAAQSVRPGLPKELSDAKRHRESLLVIDSMNQLSVPALPLLPDDTVTIRGWSLVSRDFDPRFGRTAILLLRSESGEAVHHQVDQWEARPDVREYSGSRAKSLYFGFECRASLEAVAPGRYLIELIEFSHDGPILLSSNRHIDIRG